ncbi:acetylornithine transaminase [Acidisphaera sp. S103]|uniref:acetylornithine transaminase n=1 Tax=Acidisphaera sp. S103 TaxID=1747223 RepID=UPI00131DB83F|nr:acetylornithine transaminase [Acidisphaera sp. S103]
MISTMSNTDAVMDIASRPPTVFVAGQGSWLTDSDGRRYLDFIQGWAVNCLGHSPRPIIEAMAKQAEALINCSPAFYNDRMIQLSDMIAGHSGLHQVFLANSGAEANEGAIKLARKWGAKHRDGAYEIITMDHGFHGRTLATMAASGKSQWEQLYEPKVPGFVKVPLNDLAAVEAAITPRTVAVMLEPIQGEAGVFEATIPFLRSLRALTRDKGLLLILDEIQTGIGRTGRLFGFEHAGTTPDIMTLAKGLGGGVPLAALVAHRDVCCFDYGDQGGTFCGNPLMAAAGCAVIEQVTQPGFLARVEQAGGRLTNGLRVLSQRHSCGEVRGLGLLLALDLKCDTAAAVVELARKRGLLINGPRPDSLRFMPALTVTDAEIDGMIDILDTVLSDVMPA